MVGIEMDSLTQQSHVVMGLDQGIAHGGENVHLGSGESDLSGRGDVKISTCKRDITLGRHTKVAGPKADRRAAAFTGHEQLEEAMGVAHFERLTVAKHESLGFG